MDFLIPFSDCHSEDLTVTHGFPSCPRSQHVSVKLVTIANVYLMPWDIVTGDLANRLFQIHVDLYKEFVLRDTRVRNFVEINVDFKTKVLVSTTGGKLCSRLNERGQDDSDGDRNDDNSHCGHGFGNGRTVTREQCEGN
ncbi:uncharacterized protein ARMOST_22525 [Armillaria ostoyae]|uniref:Uncharacterized protein n=1 Tax=Armillaria ostoyae TaxID=47428 RepID=A0A284SD69_ARMOS|nr:uncharacterized protein ARMOST_22525 [Armillaria ostoyae]